MCLYAVEYLQKCQNMAITALPFFLFSDEIISVSSLLSDSIGSKHSLKALGSHSLSTKAQAQEILIQEENSSSWFKEATVCIIPIDWNSKSISV